MQTTRNRKIIPTIVIGVLSLLNSSLVSSQTKGPDIVELKNGQIRQGTIVEQRPGYFLKLLRTPLNDTLTIKYSDIEALRITPQKETEETLTNSLDSKNKLDVNHNKYSVLIPVFMGTGNWDYYGLGIGVLRKFTPQIQAGIGFHRTNSIGNHIEYTSTSIFGELKYALQQSRNGRTSLLLSVAIGPNFYAYYKLANGIYFSPSIGYRINITKNTGLIIDLGYQYVGGEEINVESIKLERFHGSGLQLKVTAFI